MLDLMLSIKGKSVKITQELAGYLSTKLDSIYQLYASFENDHLKKISTPPNSVFEQDRVYRANQRLKRIEIYLFRQAMLIVVCSYLEEAMNLIGEVIIPGYPEKISKRSKENWFEKRKKLFEEAGISFKNIKDECDRINDLLVVRNCIVHSGGRVKKYSAAQVEQAVKRLKERDKNENMKLVEITDDEFLDLGENVISKAIIASQEIICQCSKATCVNE